MKKYLISFMAGCLVFLAGQNMQAQHPFPEAMDDSLITVFFKPPVLTSSDWKNTESTAMNNISYTEGKIYIYAWQLSGTNKNYTTWPGVELKDPDAYGYYAFTIDKKNYNGQIGILFHNGQLLANNAVLKTRDLVAVNGYRYDFNGNRTKYDMNSAGTNDHLWLEVNKGPLAVFRVNIPNASSVWNQPYIYGYKDGSNENGYKNNEPFGPGNGTKLVNEGNGWYSYGIARPQNFIRVQFKSNDGSITTQGGSSGLAAQDGGTWTFSVPAIPDNSFKVKNSAGWGGLYVYMYDGQETFGGWPGKNIAADLTPDGNGWYTVTAPMALGTTAIFHNNPTGGTSNQDRSLNCPAPNPYNAPAIKIGHEYEISSDQYGCSCTENAKRVVYDRTATLTATGSSSYVNHTNFGTRHVTSAIHQGSRGYWNDISTWSTRYNTSSNWIPATRYPGVNDNVIIQDNDSVAILTGNTNKVVNNLLTVNGQLYLLKKTNAVSELESSNAIAAGHLNVKMYFPADQYYFYGFPFNITGVTTVKTLPATINTNYYLATYDPATRANHLTGWKVQSSLPSLGNTDYTGTIIAMDTDIPAAADRALIFTADAISAGHHVTGTQAAHSVSIANGSGTPEDKNWNLRAYPLTSALYAKLTDGHKLYTHKTHRVISGDLDRTEDYYKAAMWSILVMPFDSYFVKADGGNGTVTFSTSAKAATRPAMLTLYINNDEDIDTYVRINEESTDVYDEMFDAPQIMPDSPLTPQIYSMVGSEKMAINTVPGENSVALGLRVPETGEYRINWNNAISEKQTQLYDNVTQQTISMNDASGYTFTTDVKGEINNRFSIRFIPNAPTGVTNPENAAVKVVVREGNIYLNGLTPNATIRIYNTLGELQYETVVKGITHQVKAPGQGVYIVESASREGKTQTKVVCK
jgi:hypothetical protein